MAGGKISKKSLNTALLLIAKLFIENNIQNWFIGYGTLLGIIRNNSCIDNDDDVDILFDRNDYDKVINILINNKYELSFILNNFIRVHTIHAPIDLYVCDISNGNYYDSHEKVTWSNCLDSYGKLLTYEWYGINLNIPNLYEKKLRGRYGPNWKIPQKSKGPQPKKTIL